MNKQNVLLKFGECFSNTKYNKKQKNIIQNKNKPTNLSEDDFKEFVPMIGYNMSYHYKKGMSK